MPWSWEWVVEVASLEDGYKLLGTGAVIGSGRVLTARHVVFDREGKQRSKLAIRQRRSTTHLPATIEWHGSEDLDAAVLAAEVGGAGPGHPLTLLSARDIEANKGWEAKGYPVVNPDNPNMALKPVRGQTCSYHRKDRNLCLDMGARPEDPKGLSGAPVVIDKHIVGIMRAVPDNWIGGRVEATPVAAFLEDRAFRDALGLKPHDERLAKDLEQLEAEVEQKLRGTPAIAVALADKLQVSDRSEHLSRRVTSTLVNTNGIGIAMVLADLDAMLHEHREILRSLLWRILPLAIDWRGVLVQARQIFDDGTNAVELPLRTETIAEIVLAGVDGRSCQFARGGAIPEGLAHIRIPASVRAPLFHTNGDHIVEAVIMDLGTKGTYDAKYWNDLKEKYRKFPERKIVVDRTFRYRARPDAPGRLPHYLLFIDAELGPEMTEDDVGAFWTVVRTALGRELPSLRLARLKGDHTTLGEEFEIATHIKAICDRS